MLSSFEVVFEVELILDEEIFWVGGGYHQELLLYVFDNDFSDQLFSYYKLIFKDVGLLTYY